MRSYTPNKTMLASVALASLALVLLYLSEKFTRGMLSSHMLTHIALMSLLAPAIALQIWLPLARRRARVPYGLLLIVTSVQIAVFAAWHSPPGLEAGMSTRVLSGFMQLTLLAVATFFWLTILLRVSANRWGTIFALLLTGKVFCLLGALMVFAPRLLFGHDFSGPALVHAMADQQLAGLLMLTACPLTYLLASTGIVCGGLFKSDPLQSSHAFSTIEKP